MSTRLTILTGRLIEAGWLAAVIVVPLYFNPSSSRIYEPDKVALLRSLAVIMAAAWAIRAGVAWLARRRKDRASADEASAGEASAQRGTASWRTAWRHPIVLAAGLLLLSHGLASAFSILPRISLWGQYDRLQGLYTVAAYLVFFFSVVALLRTRAQLQRLIIAVLLASLPVALYGILQHFEVRLWRSTFDSAERAYSTMGNPIYLAAILSLAVPLTLYRLLETRRQKGSWLRLGMYLVLLALQLVCILYTQSRGPVLGLAFAALFGGLLWALAYHKWRLAQIVVGGGAIFAVLLVVINLPNTPLSFVQDIPYVNRLAQLTNAEGSSVGRVLIWDGAVNLATEDPARMVLGYGPDATRYAFYPHHTAEIGNLEGWDKVPDRMHNESFDVIVTTGLIGFVIYVLLFTSLVYYGLRWVGVIASSRQRTVFLALWFAGAAVMIVGLRVLSQTWTFSGVALPAGMLGGALLYLVGYAFLGPRLQETTQDATVAPALKLFVILLFAAIIAHFVEINIGIAVTATRLYFWVYAALLVALGLYFKNQAEQTPEPRAAQEHDAHPASEKQPASKKRPASRKKKADAKRAKKQKSKPKPRTVERLPEGMIPLTLLAALMLGTIAFSFFSRSVADAAVPAIRGFIVAVWILTGALLAAELYAMKNKGLSLRSLAFYGGVAWLPALLFMVFKNIGTGSGLYFLVLYDLIVFGVLIALALAPRREATPRLGKTSAVSLAFGAVLAVGASVFIYQTNIQIIQANVHYNVARSALGQQRYDQAITRYRDALALDPNQGRYKLELAQSLVSKAVYETRGASVRDRLFREAEVLLEQAVSQNPFEPYNLAQLGEIYRVWGEVDEPRRSEHRRKAIAYLEEALQSNQQNILFLQKWEQLLEEDETQNVANYRELLRWDSTNVSLYMQLGRQYRTVQQWQEAATMYEGAIRHAAQPNHHAHRGLAQMYQRLGRLEEALRQSKTALDLDPETPVNHTVLINLYQRTGQCEKALEQVRAARQRWPDDGAFQTRAAQLAQQCAGA